MTVKDRTAYNAYMNTYMKNRYAVRRQEMLDYLGGTCAHCGSGDRLQIDHVNPNKKRFNISYIWSKSWDSIIPELNKCQLLCADCHEDKTIRDRGLKRNKGVHGSPMNYARYGCKCPLCKAAWNAYNKKYKHKG